MEELDKRINKVINEPIEISKEIYLKTLQLKKGREMLKEQAEKKAKSRGKWKKERAKKIMELRNLKKGEAILWEEVEVKDIPANLIKYIAEGMVSELEEDMLLQEELYDFIKTSCYNLSSEMNGLQSINKYMAEL